MPVIYDEEWGGNRIVLSPLLTIEEAVIVLLGKSLVDYPFDYYDEQGNHEETYSLEDYLQTFYDTGEESLAKDGLMYYEQLLDAIEGGELVLHKNQLRTVRLVEWAVKKKIEVNAQGLLIEKLKNSSKKQTLYESRKTEILNALAMLGYHPPIVLPDKTSGSTGIKARVWEILPKNIKLFPSKDIFNDAWESMRDKQVIQGGKDIKN